MSGFFGLKKSSAQEKTRQTELHLSIQSRNLETLRKRLTKRSAKTEVLQADFQDRIPLVASIQANLPLMVEEILRFYLENNCSINYRDSHGNTALHCACQEQLLDERIITGLLRHPGIDVRAQNLDGNTPLHFFCEKFSSPLCGDYIEQFLSMGADVNAANSFGETLLHKACLNNSIRLILVNLLLEHGADVNKLNSNNEGPLHFAVRMSREDLVLILLKAGADITARDRREGKTPAELAKNKKILARLKKVEDLWHWLESLSTEIYDLYRVKFCAEELFLDVMPMAHDKMLEKIGVKEIHRAAILQAAQQLQKAQAEEQQQQQQQTLQVQRHGSGTPVTSAGPMVSASAASGSTAPASAGGEGTTTTTTTSKKGAYEADLQRTLSGSDKWIIKPNMIEFVCRAGNVKERERIGAGTSGKVYRAIYNGKEDVAVKILKPWTSESQVEEFKKEFDIMVALRDPYIVRFYGACLEPKLALVMEFAEHDTLFDVMNNDSFDIGWDSVFRWCTQFTRAMICLHNFKPQVLHRDFKSLNILVNREWECRVCDFGLSRFNTSAALETLKQMRGTLTHMAPEVCPTAVDDGTAADKGPQFQYTNKSDIYSMGIVMWELLKRCVSGVYSKPWFSEFPGLSGPGMEIMIVLKAQQGIRPTLDSAQMDNPTQGKAPECMSKLYKQTVSQSCAERPDAEQLLALLNKLKDEYESDPVRWNSFRIVKKEATLTPTLPKAEIAAAAARLAAKLGTSSSSTTTNTNTTNTNTQPPSTPTAKPISTTTITTTENKEKAKTPPPSQPTKSPEEGGSESSKSSQDKKKKKKESVSGSGSSSSGSGCSSGSRNSSRTQSDSGSSVSSATEKKPMTNI